MLPPPPTDPRLADCYGWSQHEITTIGNKRIMGVFGCICQKIKNNQAKTDRDIEIQLFSLWLVQVACFFFQDETDLLCFTIWISFSGRYSLSFLQECWNPLYQELIPHHKSFWWRWWANLFIYFFISRQNQLLLQSLVVHLHSYCTSPCHTFTARLIENH